MTFKLFSKKQEKVESEWPLFKAIKKLARRPSSTMGLNIPPRSNEPPKRDDAAIYHIMYTRRHKRLPDLDTSIMTPAELFDAIMKFKVMLHPAFTMEYTPNTIIYTGEKCFVGTFYSCVHQKNHLVKFYMKNKLTPEEKCVLRRSDVLTIPVDLLRYLKKDPSVPSYQHYYESAECYILITQDVDVYGPFGNVNEKKLALLENHCRIATDPDSKNYV